MWYTHAQYIHKHVLLVCVCIEIYILVETQTHALVSSAPFVITTRTEIENLATKLARPALTHAHTHTHINAQLRECH